MKTVILEENIKCCLKQAHFWNWLELHTTAKIMNKNNNKENFLLLHSINRIKQKINAQLQGRISLLKLAKFLNTKKAIRNRRRVKTVGLVVLTVLSFYFSPIRFLKPVYALENNVTVFEKMKNGSYDWFFIKTEDGKQKLNIKNVILTGLGLSSIAAVIYFVSNSSDMNRFLFKTRVTPLVTPVTVSLEERLFSIEEREFFKLIKQESRDIIGLNKLRLKSILNSSVFLDLLHAEQTEETIRMFTKIWMSLIGTSHELSKYTTLEKENEQSFSYLAKFLMNYTIPMLRQQNKEFQDLLEQVVMNKPQFVGPLNHFLTQVPHLIRRNDINTNGTFFNETVNEVITLLNKETKID